MADGIDRKADERMEFSTSKEVVVSPTFQDMHLKGKDYRTTSTRAG
jgi:ATP-dependent RNA helicase